MAAAAGLEEASAAVAVGAGAAPAGPAVIGPSLPLALAMPLPEPEPLPLPLEVVRGLLPPLRIPELLSLRPRPRPPRPEPPPGLMALEVSREQSSGGQKGLDGQTAAHGLPHTETQVIFCPWRYEGPRKLEGLGEWGRERQTHIHLTPRSISCALTMETGELGGPNGRASRGQMGPRDSDLALCTLHQNLLTRKALVNRQESLFQLFRNKKILEII